MRPQRPAALALAAVLLSACGQGTATSTSATTMSASAVTQAERPTTSSHPTARPEPAKLAREPRRLLLPNSTASPDVVQPQPAPGTCHALGHGPHSRPDPRCTPGALDPAVTQATIDRTICVRGWTSSVRPPESVTESEKTRSMAAYGDTSPMGDYEYDHFVPLELGGAVNDPRNLWPEPGASPNPKDAVEDRLREEVCDGQVTLAQARRAIASNWVTLAPGSPAPTSGADGAGRPTTGPPAPGGGHCTATAAHSSRYDDYDVYVHSNQPDRTVTVTDGSGREQTWHTDSTGYADVYFKAPADASGETVVVHVGSASCQTSL